MAEFVKRYTLDVPETFEVLAHRAVGLLLADLDARSVDFFYEGARVRVYQGERADVVIARYRRAHEGQSVLHLVQEVPCFSLHRPILDD